MAIENLIPTRFMNTSRGQEADIEQTLSAANLNNAQATRIMSLLSGEMQGQAYENEGLRLDNIRKDYEIEGQRIANKLNNLEGVKRQLDIRGLEVEAENAELNMQLKQEQQRMEIAATKAKIAESASATKYNLGRLSLEQQKAYQEFIYPQVAAKFETIGKLAKSGDMNAANSLYQGLLKTLPKDFLQFEGKNGMDLLGPEIDPKDLEPLPGTGGMSLIDIFTQHAKMLVPTDSLQGRMQIQDMQDKAAMARTKVTAEATSSSAGLRNENTAADVERKQFERIAPAIVQNITQGTVNKRQIFDKNNKILEPTVSYAVDRIVKIAAAAENEGKDVTASVSKMFELDDEYVVPRAKKEQKDFYQRMKEYEDVGYEEQEAYQRTFDDYLTLPSVIKSIFD